MHPTAKRIVGPVCALAVVLSPGCKKKDAIDPGACDPGAEVLAAGTHEAEVELTWDGRNGVYAGPVLEYLLPEGVTGFLATVDLPGADTGFSEVHFAATTWIDVAETGAGGWYTEPYYHWAVSGGTVTAPIDADSAPAPGCLRLQPAALDEGTARLILQVATEPPSDPVMDLDIVVVGETQLYQEDLEEALVVMDALWRSGGGPGVGHVEVLTVDGDTYLAYDDSTALRASLVEGASDTAMRLFFIQDYLEADGTLGEAGGIPGPITLGVDEAGVILSLDAHATVAGGIDTTLLGEVMAHEVGHQLGLFHTTEYDGTRTEPIGDTPDCPASADADDDGWYTAEECVDWDGSNFMFWTAGSFPQDAITTEQGTVLVSSVLVKEEG